MVPQLSWLTQYQEFIQSTEESELDSQQQENIICESASDKDIRRDKELQTLLPQYYVELKKVGVSRYLLWQEYKQTHPDGYSYSRFCRKFKDYRRVQEVTIHLDYQAAYRLGIGIVPNIYIRNDRLDVQNGIDKVLEKAIEMF